MISFCKLLFINSLTFNDNDDPLYVTNPLYFKLFDVVDFIDASYETSKLESLNNPFKVVTKSVLSSTAFELLDSLSNLLKLK